MLTGVYAPIFNDYADPAHLVELAVAAERAGYDGFFVWDHLAIDRTGMLELTDATVVLGAIAQATSTIRFGPMITPLARRRPWKVAREIAALDRLSNGRIVFGAGLGEPADVEFAAFGEDASASGRAARLDEGLALMDRFLRGETVNYHGKHYHVDDVKLLPRGVQRPRPPVWIAASLPARAGLRRAARWDGCFPVKVPDVVTSGAVASASWDQWWLSPSEFADAADTITSARGNLNSYALVATGSTVADDRGAARGKVAAYAAAGANWWLEWVDDAPDTFRRTLDHIKLGPPS